METNGIEDLKTKVAKIERLQEKMGRMELVNEVEKDAIRELAEKVYYDSLTEAISKAVSEAIDRIGKDPFLRIKVANEILSEIGLKQIGFLEVGTVNVNDRVLDEYLSRF